jgi:cell division protease FtsH
MAGGYTLIPPQEDRRYKSKKELEANITVMLGGRASEEINLGDVTTGAMNDLEITTQVARQMVCDYGMSDRLGTITLGRSHGPVFLGRDLVEEKDYSDETARIIDEEVKRIVDEAYAKAKAELTKNKDKIKLLSERLLEKEVLDGEEVKRLLGFTRDEASPQA